jgi:hypothetical protein
MSITSAAERRTNAVSPESTLLLPSAKADNGTSSNANKPLDIDRYFFIFNLPVDSCYASPEEAKNMPEGIPLILQEKKKKEPRNLLQFCSKSRGNRIISVIF